MNAPNPTTRTLAVAFLAALLSPAPSRPLETSGTPAYETPPMLKASDFLDAALLKGPHHQIEEKVVNDGVFNRYTITSPYGTFPTSGSSLVAIRVQEIRAIAQLKEVDKVAVAAGAVVGSLVDSGKGAVNIVTNPVSTVEGLGDGAKRLFGRISRGATRTSEEIQSDDKNGAGKSTEAKVAEASQGTAEELVGVNRAVRMWAQKLGVDPYTPNRVLHDELQEVARYDAAGQFSTKLLPLGAVGTALGAASTVNDLVWEKDPDELQTLNETRLKAMGATADQSRALRLNKQYGLRRQTLLVANLDALAGVTGRGAFVARAAEADDDAAAQFYVESSSMMESYHRTQAPLTAIVPDLPGGCASARGNRFACFFALDYVVWTEGVARHVERLTARAASDFPKSPRELWISGRVSPRTAKELGARGWALHERSVLIPAAVPTPKAAASN